MRLEGWLKENCKFAAWYDPRTWGKPEQTGISDQEWHANQFQNDPDKEYLRNNMQTLVPAVLNHLEAAKLVLESHGLTQYTPQINEIIREMQGIEESLPVDHSQYHTPQDEKIMEVQDKKGLLPNPKVTRIPPAPAAQPAQVASRFSWYKTAISEQDKAAYTVIGRVKVLVGLWNEYKQAPTEMTKARFENAMEGIATAMSEYTATATKTLDQANQAVRNFQFKAPAPTTPPPAASV